MTDIETGILIKNMAREMVKRATVKNSELDDAKKALADRARKVDQKVKDIMSKLDFSKHDKKNSKGHVERMLKRYYEIHSQSSVSPQEWDEMFSRPYGQSGI